MINWANWLVHKVCDGRQTPESIIGNIETISLSFIHAQTLSNTTHNRREFYAPAARTTLNPLCIVTPHQAHPGQPPLFLALGGCVPTPD
jgi:hypothetical protein